MECVLASACLPTLHHAVSIDGQRLLGRRLLAPIPIWSRSARESPVADTLIVKLNPMIVESVPTSAREITARINHITFNQPMLRDVEVIEAVRRNAPRWLRPRHAGDRAPGAPSLSLDRGRPRSPAPCRPKARSSPISNFCSTFARRGRTETDKWLARHGRAVGATSSVDLAKHFLAARVGATSFRASSRPTPEAAA